LFVIKYGGNIQKTRDWTVANVTDTHGGRRHGDGGH